MTMKNWGVLEHQKLKMNNVNQLENTSDQKEIATPKFQKTLDMYECKTSCFQNSQVFFQGSLRKELYVGSFKSYELEVKYFKNYTE